MKTKILFLILVVFLVGCKTKYVPVPVEREHTQTQNGKDSIFIHKTDSIVITNKGDTVFVTKVHTYNYHHYHSDSIFVKDKETKPVVIENTKEVVPKWCWYLIIAVLLYIIYKVVRKKYFK